MTAEAGLRARILAAIRLHWPRRTGVSLWGRPASAASGPGHPDIGGVVRSRPIALEIKKGKGKPTPLQELRIRDLRYAGCYAWIVRSPDEAVHAVYWTAKGFTRPMSNEPLDLSAWLTSGPAAEPAQEYAPAAETPDTTPSLEMTPPDSFNFAPLSSPYTEAHHHAVEVVTGRTPSIDEVLTGVSIQAEADADQNAYDLATGTAEMIPAFTLGQLDADLRTVGDRVTMLHDNVGEHAAILRAIYDRQEVMNDKLDQLYNAVMEDAPPPEPEPIAPKRRRSGKVKLQEQPVAEANGAVEAEAVPEGAPATDDIAF